MSKHAETLKISVRTLLPSSHIGIGGICFLTTVAQIVMSEKFLREMLVAFLKAKKVVKND